MSRKQIIVAVPVYRFPLSSEEEISLRHLRHFLGGYDVTLVAPKHLEITDPGLSSFPVTRFEDNYFSGIPGYNRLMLSRDFYRRFARYEYVLIYQLDCLVFSADLAAWCEKGWDYAGAPWFKDHGTDTSEGLWAIGNGGLSLRRVSKFLEVLTSWKLMTPPVKRALETPRFANSPNLRRLYCAAKIGFHACGYRNTVRHFLKHFNQYEDLFWSSYAQQFVERFVRPSPQEALAFSFENAPRYCYELNDGRLPFGAHAWYKTDPKFWQPFLLPESIEEKAGSALTI